MIQSCGSIAEVEAAGITMEAVRLRASLPIPGRLHPTPHETRRRGLMRLSWNEVRARAARFADEWKHAAYEKGETQSFYNDFFEIFGVRRRTVARYEEHVRKLDNRSGFIDLFWPGVLIVEQKSAGRDLTRAYGQAGEYFDALARKRPATLHPGQRLPELRASRSGRGRAGLFRPGGVARPYREVRLHPGGATPNLPRSGPGQRQSLGVDGTAA